MSINIPNTFNAYGSVSAAGARVSGAGFAAAATGTGVYTLTLDQPVDAAECAILVTARGATPGFAHVVHTSDTVKTVNMVDAAGAAQDTAFDFAVLNCPAGSAP